MANVLIIDDDKTICDTLSTLLEYKGYNAPYALTLKNGLEKASGGAPDVVFLDVRMPDGDGLHMLPTIRQMPSMPEVIITQAANSEASVLISGETGTGKELFANAIHANSSRADKNLVVVDSRFFGSFRNTVFDP